MWTGLLKSRLMVAGMAWLAASSVGSAATIYVDVDATGSNDGSSWADAYTDVSTALSDCGSSDELWVAEGTYRESQFGFPVADGCGIYGGFDGTETLRGQADPATHETILSGDINADDPTISDNANHVVWFSSAATSATVMDGFTITAGYADGTSFDDRGGGMLITSASPTLSRLVFKNNHADGAGGGLYVSLSTTALKESIFHDNDGFVGGAMYVSSADITTSNCLFYDNEAGYGGAIFNVVSDPDFINLTIADNTADSDGGGIYNDAISGGSHPNLVNCILWDNADAGGTDESSNMHSAGSSSPVVTYTDWQGHSGGTGNLDENPSFSATYLPARCSDVIDAGLNSAAEGTEDLGGDNRIMGGTVDMGAYEHPVTVVFVDVDGTGNDDGTTWANAYTDLKTAFGDCCRTDEVWVAEGTYTPDDCDPTCIPSASFGFLSWKDSCEAYGGFAGTETFRSQADPATNETILSGDNNGDDPTLTDNALHVVFFSQSYTSATVMDGFTITAGYADGTSFDDSGGGMLVTTGTPTLSRLVFKNNHADVSGGAMYISNSAMVIDRCRFHDNDAWLGGAAYLTGCDLTLANSLFHDNVADDGSGSGYGGAFFTVLSDSDYINLSFGDNTAEVSGGGIYNDAIAGGSHPTLTNCILWDNTDSGGTDETSNMHSAGSSAPVVTYTDWQGHTGGTGNKNVNPFWGIDYRQSPVSQVINAGLNSAVFGSLDLDDTTRIKNGVVDMGAFEIKKKRFFQEF